MLKSDFLGERLKALRNYRQMTQSQLAGGKLTRNMLSQIERGAAQPSYATLVYLSEVLKVSPSYFFDDGPTLRQIIQQERLSKAKESYLQHDYERCLSFSEDLERVDNDEFLFLLSSSCFFLAVERLEKNDFEGAKAMFDRSEKFGLKSSYGHFYASKTAFYRLLIERLEKGTLLHVPSLLSYLSDDQAFSDVVFYVYLNALIDNGQFEDATRVYEAVNLQNRYYRIHFNARIAASRRNFDRAKELLREIVRDGGAALPYPFLYNIYDDLERYCKATDDYRGAYECAVEKRKYRS